MTGQLLRGATLPDRGNGDAGPDVRIRDGAIAEIGSLRVEPAEDVVDLDGWVLLPAAVEPHAHLDKAFLAELVPNPSGTLAGAIEAMRRHADVMTVDAIAERAERAARLMAANGYVAVRTHVDCTIENGLRSVEALTAVRDRVADVIDVQIVALAGWPVTGAAGADHRRLLDDAMSAGADLVGGCPHLEDDVAEATDVLLQCATDHGRAVDLHTDETLDARADGLRILADRVLAGFDLGATAGHCVSLAQQAPARRRETAERVAAAGIGIVVLPQTNLYLQGRGADPVPRGLTAVSTLRDAGVTVAAGADNLQDPFNPLGRACPFETAGLMVAAAHLLPGEAWATVSDNAAAVLGRARTVLQPGAPADLLAVRAASVREAIAVGPRERIVWRAGLASTAS